VHSFLGNFGVLVRAYCYIRSLGPDGLAEISREAILNANYLMRKLAGAYDLPFDRPCMHEFVLSGRNLRKHGVRTTDVAKRLLDFGVHAPTVYFPLIVEEAIMIEPTETETLRTLDLFADVMLRIRGARRGEEPGTVEGAPWTTPVSRLTRVAPRGSSSSRGKRRRDLNWRVRARAARRPAGSLLAIVLVGAAVPRHGLDSSGYRFRPVHGVFRSACTSRPAVESRCRIASMTRAGPAGLRSGSATHP
jgi:glycine cleavage system protein P-like pyridoxal-binding family